MTEPGPATPTYAAVDAAGPWRDIPNCPGRRVWRGAREATVRDLVGPAARIEEFDRARAKDPVCVVRLDIGGLISYRRADGRFVHTLNTAEGLARKLAELGIDG